MSQPRYPEIAASIRGGRLRKGWSQERAAQEVGCSRLQWIRWEQGLHKPTEHAARLTEVLGIPPEQLEDDEDNEEAALAFGKELLALVRRAGEHSRERVA